MSEIIIGMLIWFGSGAIGSALALEFGFRRCGLDITTGHLSMGFFMSFLGPANFVAGLVVALTSGEKVVFKGRGK